MAKNASGGNFPIRWLPSAETAYLESLIYIASQDQYAATLVIQRVDAALALLSQQPGLGTPIRSDGRKRFPIAKTGHLIEYYMTKKEIRITRWARHTRKS